MSIISIQTAVKCYHCGADCITEHIRFEEKDFCCTGCKLVYEVLSEKDLCTYYALDEKPGNRLAEIELGDRFAYLDEEEISNRLLFFRDNKTARVRFHIPSMHCSSCIWLLEHLGRLHSGIQRSQVDFIRRELTISYDPATISLRKVVETLVRIGYPPELNLKQISGEETHKKIPSPQRIYKIGLAGFAFGNIMLLSFPEYFSDGVTLDPVLKKWFSALNVALAIPVFFYSASEFLQNAWLSFRQRVVNIDVPIAIGIVAMFSRSLYEIFSGTGPGYLDSMTGLVFFMLIGRNFQSKTYSWLSFERDYTSYFPIAVTRIEPAKRRQVPVQDLRVNDRVFLRTGEIIPADVLLTSPEAELDYSFVSGESDPIRVQQGAHVYAGAKLLSDPAEAVVMQEVSLSHLTRLWSQSSPDRRQKSGFQRMTESISRWFVVVTFLVAAASLAYWWPTDSSRALHAFSSVLVIACACALALSAPFTFGNLLRLLGKQGIYLKDAEVIERLADIDTVVFDKTGTLTVSGAHKPSFYGVNLDKGLAQAIASVAFCSTHPLSRAIAAWFQPEHETFLEVKDFREIPGIGIEGSCSGYHIRIGRPSDGKAKTGVDKSFESQSQLWVNGALSGKFIFGNVYREDTGDVVRRLKLDGYSLSLLSGDREQEREHISGLFGQQEGIHFNLLPEEKKEIVVSLTQSGRKVMMVGDGLNDAGALLASHTGLVITDNVNNFSPGCDGIVESERFSKLPALLQLARSAKRIVIISFVLSLLYNVVGLWFAVQGTLSPVIAAILMPISTSSLVLYSVLAGNLSMKRLGLTKISRDQNTGQ